MSLAVAILFNAFTAFAELPTQMLGRQIIHRQGTYRFYRPAAHSVASTVADAPLNIIKIFIFTVIIYFMSGLALNAGAFFVHFVIVLIAYFALSALFRLFGTVCSNFDVASRLASVLITLFVTYSVSYGTGTRTAKQLLTTLLPGLPHSGVQHEAMALLDLLRQPVSLCAPIQEKLYDDC